MCWWGHLLRFPPLRRLFSLLFPGFIFAVREDLNLLYYIIDRGDLLILGSALKPPGSPGYRGFTAGENGIFLYSQELQEVD